MYRITLKAPPGRRFSLTGCFAGHRFGMQRVLGGEIAPDGSEASLLIDGHPAPEPPPPAAIEELRTSVPVLPINALPEFAIESPEETERNARRAAKREARRRSHPRWKGRAQA